MLPKRGSSCSQYWKNLRLVFLKKCSNKKKRVLVQADFFTRTVQFIESFPRAAAVSCCTCQLLFCSRPHWQRGRDGLERPSPLPLVGVGATVPL